MKDLLLITDMARLIKLFERLADDSSFALRVVNNLENVGDEIAIKKPDVVFVQTHLSGLSADILLMHLKKQLGRKRSRLVLLTAPGQVADDILKSYHGWLDISGDESALPAAVSDLLSTLFLKKRPQDAVTDGDTDATPVPPPAESALLSENFIELPEQNRGDESPGAADDTEARPDAAPDVSLEEQGITYSPRQRLSVYSEFNASFDNAVNKTPEPAPLDIAKPGLSPMQELKLLEELTRSAVEQESAGKPSSTKFSGWKARLTDPGETVLSRSKRSAFLIWLVPVIVAVVIVTFLQKQRSVTKSAVVIEPPAAAVAPSAKPAGNAVPAEAQQPEPLKAVPAANVAQQPPPARTDKPDTLPVSDKGAVKPSPTAASVPSGARLTAIPDFVPRYGVDRKYGESNPGWERYMGHITEFKILRESKTIKAIQVIDRGGRGVPESFMKGAVRQIVKNPSYKLESSEKKEGFTIERGQLSDNLSVMYYRDEQSGRLRAFVLTWR